MSIWKEELKRETLYVRDKVNRLHDFMKSPEFYHLERDKKDLIYEQISHMLPYLQTLGKRCENEGISLSDEIISTFESEQLKSYLITRDAKTNDIILFVFTNDDDRINIATYSRELNQMTIHNVRALSDVDIQEISSWLTHIRDFKLMHNKDY